ncbi:Heterodimeric geranylgeranyl pyrophosphate synthase small subunit, chloroplastic [Linum perenne]
MLTLLPLSSRSSPPVARIRLRLPIRCSISSSYSLSTELKFDLQAYWASLRKEINQKLDEAIPIRYPERIYEAMRYSALSQGAKRAPPVMCVAACELFGLDRLAAFPTACALEMFLDLNDSSSSSDTIEFIQEKKFGELGQCSAVCGGLLAGAEDDEVDMLRKYGRAVGVLYQVVNDVRKAEREEIAERKSYVGVYGVEKAMEKAMELRDDAKKALSGLEKYGDAVLPLYSFVDYAADRGFSVP